MIQIVFIPLAKRSMSLHALRLPVRFTIATLGPLWLLYGLSLLAGASGKNPARALQILGGCSCIIIFIQMSLFVAPPPVIVWVHESILVPFTGVYGTFILIKMWPHPTSSTLKQAITFAIVSLYSILMLLMLTGLVIALPCVESGREPPNWFRPMMLFGFLPLVFSIFLMSAVRWCCIPMSHSFVKFAVIPMTEECLVQETGIVCQHRLQQSESAPSCGEQSEAKGSALL